VEPTIESIAEFERPPVVEVVLGVQFDRAAVDLEVLSEFATAIKAEFPNREQVEPLARSVESFARPPEGARFEFRFGGPPLPRTWFVGTDRRLLVQLQADRLTLNWRRVELGDTYPRYASLRPTFDALRTQLDEIIARLGREAPLVDQVEVTYINELASADEPSSDRHPPLASMLTTVVDLEPDGFLPPPEDVGYLARFRIHSPDGAQQPAGRLLVSTDAAYRTADQRPIYLLKLTANLVGALNTQDSVIDMLNLGRTWVVKGFLQLTTPEIQGQWGPVT
jgi:uncharacterized protein (TIGR04255 family)